MITENFKYFLLDEYCLQTFEYFILSLSKQDEHENFKFGTFTLLIITFLAEQYFDFFLQIKIFSTEQGDQSHQLRKLKKEYFEGENAGMWPRELLAETLNNLNENNSVQSFNNAYNYALK